MKLSAPLYGLKRQARQLSKQEKIPLHMALDRIAMGEGFARWSLLALRFAATTPAARLYARLVPGDFVLLAGRPGQGKTLLGLELTATAAKAGLSARFFSLECTLPEVDERFCRLGVERAEISGQFAFDGSDKIDAGYVIDTLSGYPRGCLAVIDYLQLLDQRRETPPLAEQVRQLKVFARQTGHIIVLLSQVDRRYDAAAKPFPDISDVRLPNPIDVELFTKACFINGGAFRLNSSLTP